MGNHTLWHQLKVVVHRMLQPKIEAVMSDALGQLEARLRAEMQANNIQLNSQIQKEEVAHRHDTAEISAQLYQQPSVVTRWQENVSPGATYVDFENIFRDSTIITARHRRYLPFFVNAAPVVDIGCGRGEFLELLGEKKIEGHGIDVSPDMIAACNKKGLRNVQQADATAYLQTRPDASLGGIFSSHVIEHLPVESVVPFFALCLKKVVAGGPVIIETVNPHCLPAFKLFWLDPTHVRPLFPEFLEWCCLAAGFTDVAVQYLTESGFTTTDPAKYGNCAIVAHVPA